MSRFRRLIPAISLPVFIVGMLVYALMSIDSTLSDVTLSEFTAGLHSFFEVRDRVQLGDQGFAYVTNVADGDTIRVDYQGESYSVRLIGVDTPETVDPRKKVECFGKEASEFTTQMLLYQSVILEQDPTQNDVDRYGRLLRYVKLKNGTHVNYELIKQGFAHEYTYEIPYQYQKEFQEAEAMARKSALGLWNPSICH